VDNECPRLSRTPLVLLTAVGLLTGCSTAERDDLSKACDEIAAAVEPRVAGDLELFRSHLDRAKQYADNAVKAEPKSEVARQLWNDLSDLAINDDFRMDLALDTCERVPE